MLPSTDRSVCRSGVSLVGATRAFPLWMVSMNVPAPSASSEISRTADRSALPTSARDRHLRRRRAAHDPRLRASHRAAHDRRISGSIPAALQTHSRPARRLLRERQPSLDFASIDAISRILAGLFWARIEAIAPGIDTLQLPQDIVRTWKEDLATKKRTLTNAADEQIEVAIPRLNAKDELLRVRAFYLDIAQWAVDDPARWAQWAAPCPIGDAE